MKFILGSIVIMIFLSVIIRNIECTEAKESEVFKSGNITSENWDTCHLKINKEFISLLNNGDALKQFLYLDNQDVSLILDGNKATKLNKKKKILIEKLIPLIQDSMLLNIHFLGCNRPCNGDLALLCIYTLEPFPFSLALNSQWCYGKPFSETIILPYYFTDNTRFNRNKIKDAYQNYFYSQGRKNYLNSKG